MKIKEELGYFAKMVWDAGVFVIWVVLVLFIPYLVITAGGKGWGWITKHYQVPVQAHIEPSRDGTNFSRFQLVSGTAYGIALDTKTGELCHTYNARIDTYVPDKGVGSTITMGHPSLDSIPLCIDLSQNEAETMKNILFLNQKVDQEGWIIKSIPKPSDSDWFARNAPK